MDPSQFDGLLELHRGAFDTQFTRDIFYEVGPYLRAQLSYAVWPARLSKAHKMARFGDAGVTYNFKGIQKPVTPWPATDFLTFYRDKVEEKLGWRANCCVVNTYGPTGDLHPHRDSQFIPQLGENPTIVSISFGETRKFWIWGINDKGKREKEPALVLTLEPGDMLVMKNEFDARFMHGIRPELNRPLDRLSLTFRKHF